MIDIARGLRDAGLRPARPPASPTGRPRRRRATPAAYYLRLTLLDEPGVLAEVAAALGEAGVSIDRMRQYEHAEPSEAPVLIVTHAPAAPRWTQRSPRSPRCAVCRAAPVAIRIEEV